MSDSDRIVDALQRRIPMWRQQARIDPALRTQIHRQRCDVVVAERGQRIVADHAGIVHQDVDSPAAFGDLLDRQRPLKKEF